MEQTSETPSNSRLREGSFQILSGVSVGIFAGIYAVLRVIKARPVQPAHATMVRNRWRLFAITGALVATTSIARIYMRGGGIGQSLLGLTIAALVMMLVGVIALWRSGTHCNVS